MWHHAEENESKTFQLEPKIANSMHLCVEMLLKKIHEWLLRFLNAVLAAMEMSERDSFNAHLRDYPMTKTVSCELNIFFRATRCSVYRGIHEGDD